jgi:hypothetical protein
MVRPQQPYKVGSTIIFTSAPKKFVLTFDDVIKVKVQISIISLNKPLQDLSNDVDFIFV